MNLNIEEITLFDYNITIKITNLDNDEISPFLAKLDWKDGITKPEYEQFLINHLIEFDADLKKYIKNLPADKTAIFSTDMLLSIYEVNPGLDPSKIVIVKNKLMRKVDALQTNNYEYLPLPLNPKWSSSDKDWKEKLMDPEPVNEVVDKIWDDITARRLPENYCKVYVEPLKIHVIIEEIGDHIDKIINSYIDKSCKGNFSYAKRHKFNYIGHLLGALIPQMPTILNAMIEANYVLVFSEQVTANQIYKAIIEVNPALKWETIDWHKYQPKSNSKKSDESRNKNNDESQKRNIVANSKEVEENRLKFIDVIPRKILALPKALKTRIIGQNEAIEDLCEAISVARVGLRGDEKPIGSFLFIGPTGVGKTELAKVLSEFLTDGELIRIDCSEYSSEHEVAKLFGSPPGYVGFEDHDVGRGKTPPLTLATKIRDHPFSVVLFDEIEKAHEKVYNVLLQIMDDGRITSGRGDVCSFNEAIIIMTSNIGTKQASQACTAGKLGFGEDDRDFAKITKDIIDRCVNQDFKPEFINRLTKIVYFSQLDKEICNMVVDIYLKKLKVNLEKSQHMTLNWTNKVNDFMVEKGYEPKFGARNLERTVDKNIVVGLANEILEKDLPSKTEISIDVKDKKIVFKNKLPEKKDIKETEVVEEKDDGEV